MSFEHIHKHIEQFLAPSNEALAPITYEYLRTLPQVHRPPNSTVFSRLVNIDSVTNAFGTPACVSTLGSSTFDSRHPHAIINEAIHAALVVANEVAYGPPDLVNVDRPYPFLYGSTNMEPNKLCASMTAAIYRTADSGLHMGRLQVSARTMRSAEWDYEYSKGVCTAANTIIEIPWALDTLVAFRKWVLEQQRAGLLGFGGLARAKCLASALRSLHETSTRIAVDRWITDNVFSQTDDRVLAWHAVSFLPMVFLKSNINNLHSKEDLATGVLAISGGFNVRRGAVGNRRMSPNSPESAQDSAVRFIALSLQLLSDTKRRATLDPRAYILMVVNESLRYGSSLVDSLSSWFLSAAFVPAVTTYVAGTTRLSIHETNSSAVISSGLVSCAGPLDSVVYLQNVSPLFWYKRTIHRDLTASVEADPSIPTGNLVTGIIDLPMGVAVRVDTEVHRMVWDITEDVSGTVLVIKPQPINRRAVTDPNRSADDLRYVEYRNLIASARTREILALRLLGNRARTLGPARLRCVDIALAPHRVEGDDGAYFYSTMRPSSVNSILAASETDLLSLPMLLRFRTQFGEARVRPLNVARAIALGVPDGRPTVYVQKEVGSYHSSKRNLLAIKHGDGPLLGYELEITQARGIQEPELDYSNDPVIVVAKRLRDLSMRYAQAELDRSIGSGGVEIVSSPARLATHCTLLDKFDLGGPMHGVTPDERCGLHVHVERAYLGSAQREWAFFLFWNYGWCLPSMFHDTVMTPVNIKRRMQIASILNFRTNSTYAQIMSIELLRTYYSKYPKNNGSTKEKSAAKTGYWVQEHERFTRGSTRYGAVNMSPSTNGQTLEVRAFAGATSTSEVRRALTWVSASAEYIVAACGRDDGMAYRKLGMRGLCSFIMQNRERFESIADMAAEIYLMFVTTRTDLINNVNNDGTIKLTVSLSDIDRLYTHTNRDCSTPTVTLDGMTITNNSVGFCTPLPVNRGEGGATLGRDGSGNYVVINHHADTCDIDFSQVTWHPSHEVTVTSNPPAPDADQVWSSRND